MRLITADDAEKIFEIQKDCFIGSELWTKKALEDFVSDKFTFGFIDEHGFILCREIFDEVEIISFAVSPKFRRQGIGRRLMNAVIEKSNDKSVFLEVAENNFPAIKLYTEVGFRQISKRANYYQSQNGQQTAIVMKYENIRET
ncbi:MAG: ribosomal protein S18-alanine N-acetyltransferase [Alphaproteobacteria bacterium]|nr:ribosomal protein S18-alanine N-acetyltransferase [Alphaproteobacteria bacterium]